MSIRCKTPVLASAQAPYALPETPALPQVDIIYAHSNMNATQVDGAIGHGAKGLVLAGVGDGNAAQAAIVALAGATKHGVVVVRSSRVGSGEGTRTSASF